MKIEKIGFMTPGDMGQAVAMQLRQKGFTVCTALDKRSERSRAMAAEAGLTDLGSIARLTAECDLIMSVMNPGAGLEFAQEAAAAISTQKHKPAFIECNAIAPGTMAKVAEVITKAGAVCFDGGLIGPPPRKGAKVHLYVSGPGSADLAQLANEGIVVHVMSERIGDASAIKMCYSAFNKGTQGLILSALVAAHRLGVHDMLEETLLRSRGEMYKSVLDSLTTMPPKAYRWVPEMHEIATTFENAGLTRNMFEGEADIFEFVAQTPLGKETPENRDRSRTGRDVVRLLAEAGKKR